MDKSFMEKAFETEKNDQVIKEALNHYAKKVLAGTVNDSSKVDGVFLITALKIVTESLEQRMSNDEKEFMQHLLRTTNTLIIEIESGGECSEADNVLGSN